MKAVQAYTIFMKKGAVSYGSSFLSDKENYAAGLASRSFTSS